MKLNILWTLSLMYCTLNFVYSKDVVVDLAAREGDEYMDLREHVQPNGGRQYIFTAKDSVDIAGVKYGKLKLALRGKAKSKKVTMLKSPKGVLLVIPQGSNWRRSKEIKDVYYRVGKRSIQKINQRKFSYLQHIMTWKVADLEIRKENDNILRYLSKDGSEQYTTFGINVFVLQVREGRRHIWPDGKDRGGVFTRGIYKEVNGKRLFVTMYDDVDGQKKTSYFQFAGRNWKRISEKKGKELMGMK